MEDLVSPPSFPSSFAFDLPVKHRASQPSLPAGSFPRIALPKNGFPSVVGPRCVAVTDPGSALSPLSLAVLLPDQTSEEFVTSMEDHLQTRCCKKKQKRL
jgi:hypothetical protein